MYSSIRPRAAFKRGRARPGSASFRGSSDSTEELAAAVAAAMTEALGRKIDVEIAR